MSMIANRICCALIVLAFSSTFTVAQNQLVKIEGEFMGVRGNLMQVKGSDMKIYLVLLPPRSDQTKYTGLASPMWMRPGMYVRFEGSFDARGTSQGPIEVMDVFTPNKKDWQAKPQDSKPGIYPLGGNEEFFGDQVAGNRKPKASATSNYRVIGQVMAMGKGGAMGVMVAPRQVVQVQLAEKVQIKVAMEGAQIAQPGDKVAIDGYYNPPAETNITANSVRLSANGLLGEAVEAAKPVRKTARQRREEAAAKKAAEAAAATPADGAAKEDGEAKEGEADAENKEADGANE